MAYATVAELKYRVKIGSADASRDTVLEGLLAAAEQAINGMCNRPDGFLAIEAATARHYPGSGTTYIRIDECVAVTAVAVKTSPTADFTAWATPTSPLAGDGDWIPFSGDPKRPNFNRTPYTGIMIDPNGDYTVFPNYKTLPVVRATSRWGYAVAVPPQAREAAIAQAARWYKRGEGAWSDVLASAEAGLLMYRQALDPDVKAMLVLARLVKPAIG